MCSKTWTPLSILTLRAQSNAVRQHSLEPVEVVSDNVRTLVGHESRQMLPHSLAHDPSLAMVHREPFLQQNRGDMQSEALDAFLKFLTAGKREIIGVPREPPPLNRQSSR